MQKLTKFYISNSDGTFIKSEGHMLTENIIAHRMPDSAEWRISDMSSGMKIKGHFKSLRECKQAVASMSDEMKQKIKEAMQSDRYKNMCKNVSQYAKENGL